METGVSSMGLQLGTWINPENIARKPNNSLHFFQKYGERSMYQVPASCHLLATSFSFRGPKVLRVSCSDNSSASLLEAGRFPAFFDESKIIKNKSEEVEPYLHGRCIYLVGGYSCMMGSGKTTIGKVLAEAIGYSFCDCDKMIEEAVGGRTVAEIFKSYGEKFFRDNEGVTVWLDVPLEALAQRITTVGTHSRPLLHHESGDPYSKTMKRLSALFEERGEAYANADVRISLQNIAAKLGYEDVCNLTPTAIAVEVLVQLENFLKN
ncbi:shikimate kinase [Striga asiatica]|uniref:Shikimate kinase n=1 Tax=Striga asiatica TaxID=4170 RepID=A0A5A7PQV8_STRAF|nr:shikimate kinase [Striga asiatica]